MGIQISAAQSASDREIEPALMSINADDMMRHIQVLASDEFEGRGPGTRGEELTVDYLIGQFRRLGLKPGNPDGTYVQKVPFVGSKAKSTLSFSVAGQLMELKERDDFWAGSLWQIPEIHIENSDLIFVGYGVVAPEYDWDDFKNVDVKGKTLVTLPNDPQVPDPNDATKLDENMFKGRAVTFYAQGDHKREVAKLRGAAARITLFEPGMFGTRTWKDRVSVFGTEDFDTQEVDKKLKELGAGAEIRPEVALQLFSASGHDLAALKKAAQRRDFRPVPLNATASFRIKQSLREIESSNVVAVVEGSDPKLKNEYVIYTAHWDHFGRDPALQGDQIFNGARDNASGVAALLELAKAFGRLKTPPRRSVLFIATTGEEQGLLGAKYYAAHPLYPLERTLASLNIDVINVWGPTRDVSIIGYGKSTLADELNRLIDGHGRKATDDVLPLLGLFYRSDHYQFAKQGVPAVWMRRGLDFIGKPEGWGKQDVDDYIANHYHKVSDDIKPGWDLTGAVEDYRVYFELGYRIAQGERRPEWKPGDEFKAKRDEMLNKAGR
jgi:Zn-dependent M28 family amino/carboxypeptidase